MGKSPSNSTASRGLAASVTASVFFAGIYFVTPLLAPASAESVWGIRNILTIPIVVVALLVFRQWRFVTEIGVRIRARPWLILALLACGILVSLQLWIFSWAPLNGHALDVALGYFLLPLVLVIVGKFLYKDTLLWWHWLAAGIAAAGVAFEIARVGTVSWATLVVALGYPVYFVLRRAIGTSHLGGMFWEFVLVAPLALVFVVRELANGHTMAANPALWWFAPVFSLWTGVALILYLLASRLLSISLFGLMSYVEPALLVVASLLIGERIAAAEWPMYLAVWAAVLVLVVGGSLQLIRATRTKPDSGPSADPHPA